ncbi:MAG: S4 domain-containing protein [Hyphomicrobiales bacterium]|nr:S4 domain-containing protein [Hyphomicrobiales bacterium]MCY4049011.1 S4 domain-containing protein [Hyphomicrobiales bacterium]MCY4053442.1 S4 domain-containing protein [Hyphomicrobiales bacterium]
MNILSDVQRKINLSSVAHALQKETNFLSALQKEETLLNALREGVGLLDALREVGLASSNSEARNFVRDGAVRINGNIIRDEKYILTLEDIRESDGKIQLSIGKWRHRLLPKT